MHYDLVTSLILCACLFTLTWLAFKVKASKKIKTLCCMFSLIFTIVAASNIFQTVYNRGLEMRESPVKVGREVEEGKRVEPQKKSWADQTEQFRNDNL